MKDDGSVSLTPICYCLQSFCSKQKMAN
jgi:hypothetical protein